MQPPIKPFDLLMILTFLQCKDKECTTKKSKDQARNTASSLAAARRVGRCHMEVTA